MSKKRKQRDFNAFLESWWNNRIKEMKQGVRLSPVTLRGIFYIIRQKVGARSLPKGKSSFYTCIKKVEKKYKIPRERLNILSEPKTSLINRIGEKPLMKVISQDWENSLAVLYLEKSTILADLADDLVDRGIAVIRGMGFAPRELTKFFKQVQAKGIPILVLSDLDPSGLLLEIKLQQSGLKTVRVGIDSDFIKKLGLKMEDVSEPLPMSKRKQAHLKYLKKHFPKEARQFYIGKKGQPLRVEIDAPFSLVGRDQFLKVLLERADLALPVKPLKKALQYRRVPKTVDNLRSQMHSLVDEIFAQTAQTVEAKYSTSQESFNKIRLSNVEESLQNAMNGKAEAPAVKVLEQTIQSLQKLLEEQKKGVVRNEKDNETIV